MATTFRAFEADHLGALALTLLVALAAIALVRARPGAEAVVRQVLAAVLLAAGLAFVALDARAGVPWQQIAPLHLCDALVFVGAAALLSRRRTLVELCYFWGAAGTVPALLTPDLGEGFPHYRFLLYFAQHAGVVVAALFLPFGARVVPARGGPLRAWLWLNAYAAIVAVVDFAGDANFLYLRHKPGSATPLDWLGPWPLYILVAEVVALALFALLDVPLRRARDATAADAAA